MEKFLDPDNKGVFNIEPFMKNIPSNKKRKTFALPQDLINILQEFADFLAKRKLYFLNCLDEKIIYRVN